MPHGGEHALNRVRGAQVVPMLGGKVEEGEQRLPVLGQAGHRLVVLDPVLLGEGVDGYFGFRSGWCTVDFAEVGLHVDLDRGSDLVEHVDDFVHPTALVAGDREDLLERLPQAETAVANGKLWSNS